MHRTRTVRRGYSGRSRCCRTVRPRRCAGTTSCGGRTSVRAQSAGSSLILPSRCWHRPLSVVPRHVCHRPVRTRHIGEHVGEKTKLKRVRLHIRPPRHRPKGSGVPAVSSEQRCQTLPPSRLRNSNHLVSPILLDDGVEHGMARRARNIFVISWLMRWDLVHGDANHLSTSSAAHTTCWRRVSQLDAPL